MAQIVDSSDEKVFRIQEFLGLNESPDGDTKLKLGEASVMRNFKITRDHSLQKRPGLDAVGSLLDEYALEIGDTSSVVREDNNVSSILTMYPTAGINGAEIELSGTSASVQYSNWEPYKGYFWEGSDGNVYQLDKCNQVTENGATKYQWYMRSVTVLPAGTAKSDVTALWSGHVNGVKMVVGAAFDRITLIWDENRGFVFEDLGTVRVMQEYGKERISFFGISEKLYILTGRDLYSWDGIGNNIMPSGVSVYIPLCVVSIPPVERLPSEGGGVTLQSMSVFTNYIRVWLSPNGESSLFALPNVGSSAGWVSTVKNLVTGEIIPSSEYSISATTGGISFDTVPSAGENTIEVTYPTSSEYLFPFNTPSGNSTRGIFYGMRFVEMYNGQTDVRIFLYGDGTNKIYYSGFDENGVPQPGYFSELNVISVGSENTPVTGLVRHYSRLIAFKEDEAYSIQYGTITLPDDTSTAAFYCTPINRNLGNEAMGQARLVLNSPYTLCGKDVYEWRNNASYSSNLSIDERQAKRISDRVYATLANFDFSRCYCYDDKDHQEYYICYDKKALVYNYAADAWYYYTDFDVTCMVNLNGELYAGDSLGRLNLVSRNNRTDNGAEITGYWESGAEPFDREFMRKYSAIQWIVLKPELRSRVEVTVQTDRKSDHAKKVAAASVFSFSEADFRRWSFNTNRKPHAERLKIKAKKFVYYKLIFRFDGTNTTATVVAADMRVRYTGYAR